MCPPRCLAILAALAAASCGDDGDDDGPNRADGAARDDGATGSDGAAEGDGPGGPDAGGAPDRADPAPDTLEGCLAGCGQADAADLTCRSACYARYQPGCREGTGTIRGNVFYNGPDLPPGRLTVGLYASAPPTGEPPIGETRDPGAAPTTYEFATVPTCVPLWLAAFYDVGGDDAIEEPGAGDLLAVTADAISVAEPGGAIGNINVELR